jgi:hypothetical protein
MLRARARGEGPSAAGTAAASARDAAMKDYLRNRAMAGRDSGLMSRAATLYGDTAMDINRQEQQGRMSEQERAMQAFADATSKGRELGLGEYSAQGQLGLGQRGAEIDAFRALYGQELGQRQSDIDAYRAQVGAALGQSGQGIDLYGIQGQLGLGQGAQAIDRYRAENQAALGAGQQMLDKYGVDVGAALAQGAQGIDRFRAQTAADLGAGQQGLDLYGIQTDSALRQRGQDLQSILSQRGMDVQESLGVGDIALREALGQRGMDIQSELGLKDLALKEDLGKGQLAVDKFRATGDYNTAQQKIDLEKSRLEELMRQAHTLSPFQRAQLETEYAKINQRSEENKRAWENYNNLALLEYLGTNKFLGGL